MLENRAKPRYDRNELKRRAEEIVTRYLGPGHDEGGTRLVWTCPACRKEKKYSIRRQDQLAGCLSTACELGGSADVLTFIAYFEGLDVRHQFTEVLKRGYEILGLDGASPARSSSGPRNPAPATTTGAAAHQRHPTKTTPRKHINRMPEEQQKWLKLCYRIYARILSLCPLEERDRKYLRRRGLTYETIETGRFGSISAQRAGYLKKTLLGEFGKEELLRVPGFFEDSSGRLSFTLTGDYLLIPYHDRAGNITNIEGRTMGKIPKNMGKYVSLRGSGNHLYVFPAFASDPEKLVAFTEGVFGAVVAAQSGLAVASIQGCERYKASFSDLAPEGSENHSLLELRGVDFESRKIPYIPDADDPPNKNVLDAAPKAAHHLIERQGGRATLCSLPRGMDLDEWLLGLPKTERHDKLMELVSEAMPLNEAEKWKQAQSRHDPAPTTVTPGAGNDVATTAAASTSSTQEDRIAEDVQDGGTPEPDIRTGERSDREAGAAATGSEQPGGSCSGKEQTRHGRELAAAIYGRLLEKCPPSDAHKAALVHRGVLQKAVEVGHLGSLDPACIVRVTAELKEEFGAESLIRVPGFERGHSGKISLSLPPHGEYVLLPCFDARGLLRGVEALAYDPEKADLSDSEKTVSLDGAGAHLYVFAHHSPAEIEGFCEGPLGAILAAQEDVVLGAVGHFRRYSTKPSSGGRQQGDTILPELAGVDFGGRRIVYVPRSGPAEANARAREAEHACRHLIEKQNGEPHLLFPSPPVYKTTDAGDGSQRGGEGHPGSGEPTSMADWIVALPEEERQERLKKLFPQSPNREASSNENDSTEAPGDGPSPDDDETRGTPLQLPSTPALVLMGLVGLVTAIASYLLIGRLQSFSEYIGVGYGGQPFIGGGPVGSLRRLAGSALFDSLYVHKLSLSLLPGLVAFSGACYIWHARRRLTNLAEDLQRFASGPWSAHRLDADSKEEEQLLAGIVSARDLLGSVLGGTAAFAFLYVTLALARNVYNALTSLGVTSGAYGSLFHSSASLALIGALAAGVYVLLNRTGKHRGRARIAQGRIRS